MLDWTSYPYFYSTLGGFLLVLVVAALAGTQRRAILASGVLALTLTPWAVTHEGVYWTPKRILPGKLGVEDFLFTFVIGGLSWAVAVVPLWKTICPDLRVRRLAARFVAVYALSSALLVGLLVAGVGVMTANVLLHFVLVLAVLVVRPDLWPMAVAGSVGFALLYTALLVLELAIWADFIRSWNTHSVWSWRAAGVPLGEVVWSASAGAAWPLVVAYAGRARRGGEGAPVC